MSIKSVKMKISHVPRIIQPKIRFLDQKVCSVAHQQTDTQTHTHESEYRGHPFRFQDFFLQPAIKDRSKKTRENVLIELGIPIASKVILFLKQASNKAFAWCKPSYSCWTFFVLQLDWLFSLGRLTRHKCQCYIVRDMSGLWLKISDYHWARCKLPNRASFWDWR